MPMMDVLVSVLRTLVRKLTNVQVDSLYERLSISSMMISLWQSGDFTRYLHIFSAAHCKSYFFSKFYLIFSSSHLLVFMSNNLSLPSMMNYLANSNKFLNAMPL